MRSPEPAVSLAPLTTLGIGGAAAWYTSAESAEDVSEAADWARQRGVVMTVLGGGSNVVIADRGVDGLVLRVGIGGIAETPDDADVLVKAGAGERWDDLVAWAVERGLAGLECLSGIPGTIGGTPIQNVGAYGQEVSSVIERLTVFDRHSGALESLGGEACGFGYRSSRFKSTDAGRFVVCDVTFRLRPGPPTVTYPDLLQYLSEHGGARTSLADTRNAVLAVRRSKGMVLDPDDVDTRSVGSFFTNPVLTRAEADAVASRTSNHVPAYSAGSGLLKVPAAWLLEHAGCGRGYGAGAVGLSSKHTLAVINRGGATAAAVVDFAIGIKRRVADAFGVNLVPEPTFLGFADDEAVRELCHPC